MSNNERPPGCVCLIYNHPVHHACLCISPSVLHGLSISVHPAWFIPDPNPTANYSNRPKANFSMSKLSPRESSNYLINQNLITENTMTKKGVPKCSLNLCQLTKWDIHWHVLVKYLLLKARWARGYFFCTIHSFLIANHDALLFLMAWSGSMVHSFVPIEAN